MTEKMLSPFQVSQQTLTGSSTPGAVMLTLLVTPVAAEYGLWDLQWSSTKCFYGLTVEELGFVVNFPTH